jgi:hypothetical protein
MPKIQFPEEGKMQRVLLVCSLALLVVPPILAQSAPATIKGVKIISTSFDPVSEKKQITFVNDSTTDITAYEIVAVTTYANGFVGKLYLSQELLAPGWRTIDLKHRPFLHEAPPTGDVIHPGESVTKEWGDRHDSGPAVSAVLTLDVVIYANGKAQTTDPARLNLMVGDRRESGKLHHRAAAMAREILSDENTGDNNALLAMRDKLGIEQEEFLRKMAGNFTDALAPNTFKGSPIEAILWDHKKKGDGAGHLQVLREFAEEEDSRARELDAAATIKAVNQ